jgi:hypothetical protein
MIGLCSASTYSQHAAKIPKLLSDAVIMHVVIGMRPPCVCQPPLLKHTVLVNLLRKGSQDVKLLNDRIASQKQALHPLAITRTFPITPLRFKNQVFQAV